MTWFERCENIFGVFVLHIYLAKYLSGDSAVQEKKRHDLAVERYENEYRKYQENRTKH